MRTKRQLTSVLRISGRQALIVSWLAFCLPTSEAAAKTYRSSTEAQQDVRRHEANREKAGSCVLRVDEELDELADEKRKLNLELQRLDRESDELRDELQNVLRELTDGLYCSKCSRTASEIERETRESFRDHLDEVDGEPVRAPAELRRRKREEYHRKIDSIEAKINSRLRRQVRAVADQSKRRRERQHCEAERELAREGALRAERWFQVLKRLENDKKWKPSDLPTPLSADRFGLGKNMRNSEYAVERAYLTNGQVQTLEPGVDLDANEIARIAIHYGIDFTSRDPTGRATPMPFSAGLRGKAWIVPGSAYNTVNVYDPRTRWVVQFLHASQTSEQLKACTEQRPCDVSPKTVLGMTGRKGADEIHLHIQVKDSYGNYVHPDLAFLPTNSPFLAIENEVREAIRTTPSTDEPAGSAFDVIP